jgi:hypothetical protein
VPISAGITISGNKIFVAQNQNHTIGEYTTTGATVNADLISNVSSPVGIVVTANDIFVANYSGTEGIEEFTLSGTAVGTPLVYDDDGPNALALSGNDLFVSNDVVPSGSYNESSATIGEYTTSGTTVNASLITGVDQFNGEAGEDGAYGLFLLRRLKRSFREEN